MSETRQQRNKGGQKLEAELEARNLTQAQLAQVLDTSRPNISFYISGTSKPRTRTRLTFELLFDIDPLDWDREVEEAVHEPA